MGEDESRGTTSRYNFLNLPFDVVQNANNKIKYEYDFSGTLMRISKTENGVTTHNDYIGPVEYENNQIKRINHDHGFIELDDIASGTTHVPNFIVSDETHYREVITSDAVIFSGSTEFWATECIELQEDFEVRSGAEFLADFKPYGQETFYWTVTDHKGNVRTILDDDGNVEDAINYYPFNLRHDYTSDPTYEWNIDGGLEQTGISKHLDVMAHRLCDRTLGRFWNVDPASPLRSWVSGYNMVQNNPINRVDPTGMLDNPIYGEDGKFLGVDSEGFTGNVVVMNEFVYNRLTDGGTKTLDHRLTTALVDNTSLASNLEDSGISAEAVSNVLTHVTLQTEGINFDRLEGGIIHTIDTQNDAEGLSQINGDRFGNPTNPPINATAMEVTNPDGSINVTTRMLFGQSPMNTVEHIQSTLGIHEYKGHGLLNIGGGADEKRAYILEYRNKATFNKLTPRQQNLIKQNADIK